MLHIISSALLCLGVLLEATLLALLWTRRDLLQVPLFTVLIGFYLLRSLATFATASAVSRLQAAELSSGLAAVDVLLQLGLGCSLFLHASKRGAADRSGFWTGRFRGLLLPLNLLGASGLTLLLVQLLPSRSPVPVDRGSALCAFFFLGLLAIAGRQARQHGLDATILQGFAALGGGDLIAQCGKVLAASHRAPKPYLFFAYFEAGVWLVILLVWVMRLGMQRIEPAATAAPIPG